MFPSAFKNVPIRFGFPIDGLSFVDLRIFGNQVYYELGVSKTGDECLYSSEVSYSGCRRHRSCGRDIDAAFLVSGYASVVCSLLVHTVSLVSIS